MNKEINRILTKKIDECGGDMTKLQESLSDYFDVPLEDIQTTIRMTIPVKESILNKDDNIYNVNLSLKVKDIEPIEELCYEDELDEIKQEGIIEGKLEVARNLYDENIMSLEEISNITGLSIDELNDI